MKNIGILFLLLAAGCAAPKIMHKENFEGVDISYHWKHSKSKPSELILRIDNKSLEDRRVSIVLDLSYQGKTVETLLADTCIRVGQSLNGKLNGIYFVPEQVTAAQIKSGDVLIDMSRTFVEPLTCE